MAGIRKSLVKFCGSGAMDFLGLLEFFGVSPFPKRITLDDDISGFMGRVDALLNSSRKSSLINLSSSEFIYPSALVYLAALRECFNKAGKRVDLVISENTALHEYLIYSGFSNFIALPKLADDYAPTLSNTRDVIPLKVGSTIGDTHEAAREIVDLLKLRQDLSPMVDAATIDSVDEMLRNILQHSGFSSYFLMAQAYPQSKRIRFVVYDNGMGIKAHLTAKEYKNAHATFQRFVSATEYERVKAGPANLAIELASIYGVSATSYQNNSGAGLNFLIEKLSVPTNGVVTIVSGDGLVQWRSGKKVESRAIKHSLPGTLVSVTIDCSPGSVLAYRNEVRS